MSNLNEQQFGVPEAHEIDHTGACSTCNWQAPYKDGPVQFAGAIGYHKYNHDNEQGEARNALWLQQARHFPHQDDRKYSRPSKGD